MKAQSLLLFFIVVFFSCNDKGVKKPSKLIEEEKMVDIIYDMSVLEAITSSSPGVLEDNSIDSRTYIYKKYSIDSLQFTENSAYYASDLKNYKKMYETVEKRIEDNKKVADSLLKKRQEEDNKKAVELRLLNKDSIKKPRNMKEVKSFVKKQK